MSRVARIALIGVLIMIPVALAVAAAGLTAKSLAASPAQYQGLLMGAGW